MRRNIEFEESLAEDFSHDPELLELPLDRQPVFFLGTAILIIGLIVGGRMLFLSGFKGEFYSVRAESNLNSTQRISAPRAPILDRHGRVIADNKVVFRVLLDTREFLKKPDLQRPTISAIEEILGISPEIVREEVKEKQGKWADFSLPVLLSSELEQGQLVRLRSLNLSTLKIEDGYGRDYPFGPAFSTMIGYTGLVNASDLEANPKLTAQDTVGKAGLEKYYDEILQGKPGITVEIRNSVGEVLGREKKSEPRAPEPFKTTIDGELQKYFYERMKDTLARLNRTGGVGIAMDPRNGEILALVSMPSYDANIFSGSGRSEEVNNVLYSSQKPLFNRAVSGVYSPGSTIKPLVGLAALKEGVITPTKEIFSPGYLEIPNPYNPDNPTRYPDWRYQGDVNLYSAIAYSSNVYFYTVGGGTREFRGLGISRLHDWWKKFKLDEPTGVDLPGDNSGFLPTPEWKSENGRGSWLLGDTYNVSIGQGDFQITPLALLNYINAIANGGTIYEPKISAKKEVVEKADLTDLLPQIKEVQRGMVETVRMTKGTAHVMSDLPFQAAGKTGSAQVENNKKENAFFVGYAPAENPRISVLILVENAVQGSLNAVPVAEDVLNWYYENRIAGGR